MCGVLEVSIIKPEPGTPSLSPFHSAPLNHSSIHHSEESLTLSLVQSNSPVDGCGLDSPGLQDERGQGEDTLTLHSGTSSSTTCHYLPTLHGGPTSTLVLPSPFSMHQNQHEVTFSVSSLPQVGIPSVSDLVVSSASSLNLSSSLTSLLPISSHPSHHTFTISTIDSDSMELELTSADLHSSLPLSLPSLVTSSLLPLASLQGAPLMRSPLLSISEVTNTLLDNNQ